MPRKFKKRANGKAPKPIKADWSSDCVGCIVTFDKPLTRQDISQSLWAVVVGGWVRRSLGARVIQGKRVGIRTVSIGVRSSGSHLTYKPGGTPVTGLDGKLVAEFREFPINAPAVRKHSK